jgi:hypothetical protein
MQSERILPTACRAAPPPHRHRSVVFASSMVNKGDVVPTSLKKKRKRSVTTETKMTYTTKKEAEEC